MVCLNDGREGSRLCKHMACAQVDVKFTVKYTCDTLSYLAMVRQACAVLHNTCRMLLKL